MAIKADNRDLPRGESEGNPPDPTPRIGHLLAEKWGELDRAEPHTKSRDDVEHYVRLGWAGKCARDIGYRLLDVAPSNPPDLAALWRMGLGTKVHELLQDVIVAAFPGSEVEKVVGAEHDELFGFPVSGRSDLFLVEDHVDVAGAATAGKRTVVEVKTVNGFGFKSIIGARGPAEGPRTGWLYQAAFNGRAHAADEVVIVALSMECLSDRELTGLVGKQGGAADPVRKFVAEWTYPMHVLDEMVDHEQKRLGRIIELVDAYTESGVLPPRQIPLEMPNRGRVVDPTTGQWTVEVEGNVMDQGKTWWCGYCDYKDRCIEDGTS